MKTMKILYWVFTLLLVALMLFSAVSSFINSPGGAAFAKQFGYPSYIFKFLAIAKILGIVAILVPGFPRLKEWAYAGFAINLVSALIAHLSIGDRPAALVPSAFTSVLWGLSYFFWRRLQATPASD